MPSNFTSTFTLAMKLLKFSSRLWTVTADRLSLILGPFLFPSFEWLPIVIYCQYDNYLLCLIVNSQNSTSLSASSIRNSSTINTYKSSHAKTHQFRTPPATVDSIALLSPVKSTLTTKLRVSSGFDRNHPPLTLLFPALTNLSATCPLQSTLAKNRGRSHRLSHFGPSTNVALPISIFHFRVSSRPLLQVHQPPPQEYPVCLKRQNYGTHVIREMLPVQLTGEHPCKRLIRRIYETSKSVRRRVLFGSSDASCVCRAECGECRARCSGPVWWQPELQPAWSLSLREAPQRQDSPREGQQWSRPHRP